MSGIDWLNERKKTVGDVSPADQWLLQRKAKAYESQYTVRREPTEYKEKQALESRIDDLRKEYNRKNLFGEGSRSLDEIEREINYLRTGSDKLLTDRIFGTASGAAKSTASNYANIGGVALEGLSSLNDAAFDSSHKHQVQAAQNSIEYWTGMLSSAKTDAERTRAQQQIDRNTRILEDLGALKSSATKYVDSAAESVYAAADALAQSAYEDIAEAKEGLGAVGQFLVDTGVAGTQLAGDIGIGVLTGGSALVPMALRGFGGASQEARQDGASYGQQLAYGLGSAALSVGTEKLFGVTKPLRQFFGKGLADDIVTKLSGKMMDSAVGRTLLNALGEGTEESIESIINPLLANVAYGKEMDYSADAWADILYDGLVGFAIGGIAGGAGEASTTPVWKGSEADLVNESLELRPDDAVAQKAKANLDAGKRVSSTTMNRLIRENEASIQEHDAAAIAAAAQLQLSGMGEADADSLSMTIAKAATGQSLTRAERKAIETSENASAVLSQIQAREQPWVQDIDTYANMAERSAQESVQADTAQYGDQEPQRKTADLASGGIAAQADVQNATVSRLSDGKQAVAEKVMSMGVSDDTAQKIIDNFIGGNGRLYASNAGLAYNYGKLNLPESSLSKVGINTDQYRYVYNLGKADAAMAAAQAQTKANVQNAAGQVIYESNIDRNTLTKVQKASVDAIEGLSKLTNIRFHIVESTKKGDSFVFSTPDGDIPASNGWYVSGTNDVYIDVNAGSAGEGVMLYTASHEISHYVKEWSDKKWREMADYIIQEYAKNDVPLEALLEEQAQKIRRRKPDAAETQIMEEAYEELVSDALSEMLVDGKVAEKLAEIKAKDKTLWEKIKEAVASILKKWKAVVKEYAGRTPDAAEAQFLRDTEASLEKLQQLFAEGIAEADTAVAAAAQTASESIGIRIDSKTKTASPDMLFSERTWTQSDYVKERKKAARELADALGVSQKKALAYIDSVNSIARMIADDRVRLDYMAIPGQSAFESNVEYGGSIDMTTMCEKSRIFFGTFDAIQRMMPNTALTAEDLLKIRQMLKDYNHRATCGLCYVAASRAQMGVFAKEFLRLYKKHYPNRWQPTMVEANTPDGAEWMRINHPEAYEQYEYFWNHYGTLKPGDPNLFASQQKPKLYKMRTEYQGEILSKFSKDTSVAEKNRNGGLRVQSFSDFEIVHLIDMMQVVMDMSRVGLAGQAYTKVPDFAWALGDTGMKINLSLIASGVDENGRLLLDPVEGMPIETAMELRDRYSKNVGTIVVTFNDEQLMAAMADERIDFIIPFHRSQWKKAQYAAIGLPKGVKDYTYMQNEKYIKPQYHEYRGRMVRDKAKNYMPNEYWDFSKTGKENAENYLRMCAESNKRPKFYRLLQNNGDGSYSLKSDGSTDGYWKLLIDFKMYDNDGVGSPQLPVVPDFNMEKATQMLNDYEGGHNTLPVARDVVEAFVSEYNGRNEADIKLSERSKSTKSEALSAEEKINDLNRQLSEVEEELLFADFMEDSEARMYRNKRVKLQSELDKLEAAERKASRLTSMQSVLDNLEKYRRIDLESIGNQLTDSAWDDMEDLSINELRDGIRQIIESRGLSALEMQAPKMGVYARDVSDWRLSDRTSGASNRDILSGVFLELAQTDAERMSIEKYRSKITQMNEAEEQLRQLRSEIKDLSFSTGNRDKAKIASLREQATKLANNISTYDRQLLRLEASKPLQDLLAREKKAAADRSSEVWRERIERQRTGRNRTEAKRKLQKVVKELQTMLLNGDKKNRVMVDLQKVTAEALSAINMDTVDADARLQKIQREIDSAKTEKQRMDAMRRYENVRRQGENIALRLGDLDSAYRSIMNSPDVTISAAYHPEISDRINALAKEIGDTPLRNMTLQQIESAYEVYKMVLTTIRNANRTFAENQKLEISELSDKVMREVSLSGKDQNMVLRAGGTLRKLMWDVMKPERAFRIIGSDTLTSLYRNLRKGEDVWATDMADGNKFFLDTAKKHGAFDWDLSEMHEFTSANGKKFQLSLEQIMSLYAYSKREQGLNHLLSGGFIFDKAVKVKKKSKLGIPVEYTYNTAVTNTLDYDIIKEIVGTLTPEQAAFADDMQAYLSDAMAQKGNSVSRELYGVDIFNEEYYFPLRSADQYMAEKLDAPTERSLINSGFTQQVNPQAKNPIVLGDFLEVWSRHVDKMSTYHALVLPIEDMRRVLSYKTVSGEYHSVKATIQTAYTENADRYISNLLRDVNGGIVKDSTANILDAGLAKFKKGATFASLSVLIQQPSSLPRAFAYIDPKYFVAKPTLGQHAKLWEEVKQYAPVARIKEIGYFDANMGRSAKDILTKRSYETVSERAAALVNDARYRDDVLSRGPALADEITWVMIWQAVKKETAATTDLEAGSKAFFDRCSERFTEIVTNTQVYDSVFSRSQIMRSKDTGAKMATAFASEPITTLNMLMDAIMKFKRGDKAGARRTYAAVAMSTVLNAILVSFVYAARDDDEDKTYGEKYVNVLVRELIEGSNPLTLIPYFRDIVSIFQGYDVERTDMSIISDLVSAWNKLDSQSASAWEKVESFGGSIANVFGVPFKNFSRDVRALYNTAKSIFSGKEFSAGALVSSAKESLPEFLGGGEKSNTDKLYEAMASGDSAYIKRMKEAFADETAVENAIRSGLRKNEKRIRLAAEQYLAEDITGYMQTVREIVAEGHFTQDQVVKAVISEYNSMVSEEEEINSSSALSVSDYASAAARGDRSAANMARTEVINYRKNLGDSQAEAEEYFMSEATTAVHNLMKSGDINETKAETILRDYVGLDEVTAKRKAVYWNMSINYPEYGFTESTAAKYYEELEPQGISVSVFAEYYQLQKGVTADKDENGNTIQGSKKSKIMEIIDSLPLNAYQKNALYFYNDWAADKLYEAPWH